MLDTALLASPPVNERKAAEIEAQLKTRQAWDNLTGEQLYKFVGGSLPGSWASSVAVNVKRQRFKGSSFVDCDPYITVEGSVHKALLGHNVFGGPLCPVSACRWFVNDVAQRLGVELPFADLWEVVRVDWAEVFDLGKYEAVEEYIHGLRLASFPRRKVVPYGDESLNCPGTTTTWKAYHKGPEFSNHDFKRLRNVARRPAVTELMEGKEGLHFWKELQPAIMFDVAELQDTANRLLRIEVEVKSKKLRDAHRGRPSVVQLSREWLEALHDVETARVLREGSEDMKTVRKHADVSKRLHEVYGDVNGRAELLFGFWLSLAALGEKEVKKNVSKPTFYRQRNLLQDAGVSWAAADVYVKESKSAIPDGFSPIRSDARRLTAEAPEVVAALAPFRLAA